MGEPIPEPYCGTKRVITVIDVPNNTVCVRPEIGPVNTKLALRRHLHYVRTIIAPWSTEKLVLTSKSGRLTIGILNLPKLA
jgi:hypothetical protein